ncbi:phage terminase large subunit GpA-like protein [Xylophilus ampelinus]|uniref:Phage terminase large subunit GpA-like protein n=2 Tax=Xylophilus ampelinus TaxID=54067 RepID=A0A318SL37_9BURK|nr:phage terminase large subunit GpA-like protein [Xylophilus ampelinus]
MVLPKSAPHPGPFRFERTPYARRIAQVLSPGHPCKRVVAKVASQMFKTQTAINWIGACIHRAPANILALQPTDGLAKRFSARVAQAIRNVKVLRECVSAEKSRDKRNTTQAKDFKGDATLYINTAGAAANLAEITVRYLFIDEVDRLPPLDEGDSVEIAEARATQHERDCKFYEVSSPTVEGFSRIDELYLQGTQEIYLVPCPHCGHHHPLELDNFRYRRDPETGFMDGAWFVCPDCGSEIEERYKTTMFLDEAEGGTAHWHAQTRGDGETISVTMSAFYMPIGAVGWLSLARQYERAKEALKRGDHTLMQAFYNTRLALSYRNSETTTTAKQLRDRAESYAPRVLPDAALVATMAVDTQPNRLELQIEGWGPDMERWVLDYITLVGSPTEPPEQPGSVWYRLDEIRRTPLLHASGRAIMISAYGVDAGGANTQDVYNYGAARKAMNCTVLAGATRPNKPIISSMPSKVDIDWNGTKTPGGVERWEVGTDVAKDYIAGRMHLESGPGAMHHHDQLPPEWCDQMVVEQRRTRYTKGRAISEWVKPNGARNEAWDVSVYNLAIAYQLGLHKWSALDWRRLREKLIPRTADLFALPGPTPLAPAPAHAEAVAAAQGDSLGPARSAAPSLSAPAPLQTSVNPQHPAPLAPPPPPPASPAPLPPPAPTHRRMRSKGIQ